MKKKKKNRNDEKNSWQEKMLYSMRWTQKKKTIHEYIAKKFDHIRCGRKKQSIAISYDMAHSRVFYMCVGCGCAYVCVPILCID